MKEAQLIQMLLSNGIEIKQSKTSENVMVAFIKRDIVPFSLMADLNENNEVTACTLILNSVVRGVGLDHLNKINRAAQYLKVFTHDEDKVVFEYKLGSEKNHVTPDMLLDAIHSFEKDVVSVLDESTITRMAADPYMGKVFVKPSASIQ
jgi:hypothetical protein